MKRLLAASMLLTASMPSTSLAAGVASAIDASIASAPLHGSHIGVLVTALPSGRVIYAHNASDAFTPASTLKVLTGIAALEILGSDTRFTTDLSLSGKVRGNRFDGDIVLRTDGDPLLTQADIADAADAVAVRGITEIHGQVKVVGRIAETLPYPEGWLIDDQALDYAPPVAGIVLDENVVHASVGPLALTKPATVGFRDGDADMIRRAGYSIENTAFTGRANSEDSLTPFWGQHTIGVMGSIPMHSSKEDIGIAIPDPPAFIHAAFVSDLMQRGVSVSVGMTPTDVATVQHVWSHRSPTVREIVKKMWLHSDNLIAETLLEEIGFVTNHSGDARANGLHRELAWLHALNFDTKSIVLSDGSGLSRYNLVTQQMYARIFAHIWMSGLREAVLASLPLSGRRGTLEHAFTHAPLAGAYYAKTGGMRNVANLTGFLHTRSGNWLTVTIFADDAPIDDADLRALQTKILLALI